MSIVLTKSTGYLIRQDRHELLANKLNLNEVKRMSKRAEKGIIV